MFRHVPNALTASRLILAIAFFVMLSYYQYGTVPARSASSEFSLQALTRYGDVWLLHAAFLVYLVALFTDFLDGYLARRWKVEGAFGRVVDPFVDKVLVLGSFIFFAGKNFTIPLSQPNPTEIPGNVYTITGVVPWMVVLLLARELLVTSLRGSSEERGQNFGAAFSGKVKMVAQSVTILAILLYVNYRHWLTNHQSYDTAATAFRDFCIWATVAITVISGLLYIRRAMSLYQRPAVTT